MKMINDLTYLLDYIYEGKEMKIVYIIGIALMIIRIVVPILLILVSSIDLLKALTQSDGKSIKKIVSGLVIKFVIAVIIFLLPSLVLSLIKSINKYTDVDVYYTCLLNPKDCEVELWEDPPVIVENPIGEGYIVYIRNRNGIYVPADEYYTEEYLIAMLQDYLTGYFGSYDPSVPITPGSLDSSGYSAVGTTIGNKKATAKPITDYINVDEYNQKIANIVNKYGLHSRQAVVEIAKLMATMNDEYTVPYQLGGSYRADASDATSFYGINPNWGTVNSEGKLVGMDCRNSVIWLYAQDGIAMVRGQAYGGEGRQLKDIKAGQPGDVLDSLGHIMLITDKDDTGYTVLEENGGGGWVQRKYTYKDLERSDGDLDYKVYDMTDTINGTNEYINSNKRPYGTGDSVADEATRELARQKIYKTTSKEQTSSKKETTSSKKEQTSSKKEQTSTKTEEKKKETIIDKVKNWFSSLFS